MPVFPRTATRDSSIDILTNLRAGTPRNRGSMPGVKKVSRRQRNNRLWDQSSFPSNIYIDYFPSAKWSERDTDLSPPYRIEVKNSWSCNPNSSCNFMVGSLITHRTIYTATLTLSRTMKTRGHGDYRYYPVITR